MMTSSDTNEIGRALDWTTELTAEDWDALVTHYNKTHGIGNLELVRFLPFMRELKPDSVKRYLLWSKTVPSGLGLVHPLPAVPVMALLMVHFYCVIRYHEGVLYEIIAARDGGASRSEVADVLSLAWLHAGPAGMNATARAADLYMRLWNPLDEGASTWPAGWAVDAEAFRSGVDFSQQSEQEAISEAEIAAIRDWYVRVHGEVPAHVTFLAAHYPLALKAFRARYENATGGSLPKQMVAICQLHLAASLGSPDALHRSLRMAKHFGVRKDHVVQVLAMTQVYNGDFTLEMQLKGLDGLLDAWG
jgi:alkylhydroperoxidase/carboxymuconolactone decarboxylase family protein YurZ